MIVRRGAGGAVRQAGADVGGAPEEDAFAWPSTWYELAVPRRGGWVPSPVEWPGPAAVAAEDALVAEHRGWIDRVVASGDSDPELVRAALAYLGGAPDAGGAACVAAMLPTLYAEGGADDAGGTGGAVLVDAWTARHGLAFAVRAAAATLEVGFWRSRPGHPSPALLGADSRAHEHGTEPSKVLRRARHLLSVAEEGTYREALAAAERERGTGQLRPLRRAGTAYLFPEAPGWVDAWIDELPEWQSRSVWTLLVSALGSRAQVDRLAPRLGWYREWAGTVATVADGLGADAVPLLAGSLRDLDSGDAARQLAELLLEFPTDGAFRALLERADDRSVAPVLWRAVERYPVRALRLLAAAARDGGATVRHLLDRQLRGRAGELETLLERVDPATAAFLRTLPAAGPAGPAAAEREWPAVLASPPWERPRRAGRPRVVDGLAVDESSALHWQEGERESWTERALASHEWRVHPEDTDWAEFAPRAFAEANSTWPRCQLLWQAPVEVMTPLLLRWHPNELYYGLEMLRPIVAKYDAAAVPVALRTVWNRPAQMAPLLLPVREVTAARLMAEGLVTRKSVRRTARSWFVRHGVAGALLLVPDAVGPAGPARTAAGQALRLVAAGTGTGNVTGAGSRTETGSGAAAGAGGVAGTGAGDGARTGAGDGAGAATQAENGSRTGGAARAEGPATAAAEAAAPDGARALTAAVAERYGAAAAEAVAEVLSVDPLVDALPARLPQSPQWLAAELLPPLPLRSGTVLPEVAVHRVLTMLALSKPGAPYPGLALVAAECAPGAWAAFCWAVFEEWRLAGMPAKESWALSQLGEFGDDGTARLLAAVVRRWPGQKAGQRAAEGLDVLAAIGTDAALAELHGISRRVRFAGVRDRAREKVTEVALGLGLTPAQLADRLVPDLGLDTDGTVQLDYGPRAFTVTLGADLQPYVLDAAGKRRAAPPAPAAGDDPELAPAARKRYAALKKELRTVGAEQVLRLESAMLDQRGWGAGEFRSLFLAHPLLAHLGHRLLWTTGSGAAQADGAFRIAEDRTFADQDDKPFELPADATVRLAHPARLGAALPLWTELFTDYLVIQPFPQLGRPVMSLTADEAAGDRLPRFEGRTAPAETVRALLRRGRGWSTDHPGGGEARRIAYKHLPDGRRLSVVLDPGLHPAPSDTHPEQTLREVWLGTRPGRYADRAGHRRPFAELDTVTTSELLAELEELTQSS
ncbi:DUF4132 domain-containing protein [Kitasatospora phosalacinea]|uniref:DUF4132 domain-containing protein n=1 Tax=Kitasatospora phosalacinea TaxID=2065 RepID=UPI0035D74FB2